MGKVCETFTPGLIKAITRGGTRRVCTCGFPIPKYPGRYSTKCPACGEPWPEESPGPSDMDAETDQSGASEAIKAVRERAAALVSRGNVGEAVNQLLAESGADPVAFVGSGYYPVQVHGVPSGASLLITTVDGGDAGVCDFASVVE